MSDLYNRIVNQRGSLENLVARIPGFRGYLNNKARRQADRMVRDYIASQLSDRIQRLNGIERKILDNGGLSLMSETRRAKDKLQLYHDRVKAAAPGYSGFFDSDKLGEVEMQMIYNFDEAQVRYLDQFDQALDSLDAAAKSQEGLEEQIEALAALADEANQAFSLREDVIHRLDQTLLGGSGS